MKVWYSPSNDQVYLFDFTNSRLIKIAGITFYLIGVL